MKIEHLRTKERYTLDFKDWQENYVERGLQRDYKIIEQDTVFLMDINADGSKNFIRECERAEALELVKENPKVYDFIEQSVSFRRGNKRFSINTREFINSSYEHFEKRFGKALGNSLNDAYRDVTGKIHKRELLAEESSQEVVDEKVQAKQDLEATTTVIPKIYKLSIGPGAIHHEMYMELINDNYVAVHNSTGALWSSRKTQFEVFSSARSRDYFFLCRGNQEVVLVGEFTNDVVTYSMKEGYDGWGLRKFKIVKTANSNSGYNGSNQKWWTPNHNSTFAKIPTEEYALADELIFKPFFNERIGDLMHVKINYPPLELKTIENSNDQIESTDTEDQKKTPILIESATPFSISDKVDGVIGVKAQALELSELLIDLKNEKGMMVGVFGRWGRGKTKLWEEIKDYISSKKPLPFNFVEFHAWKYQDTPASWAYLYELVTKQCVRDSSYLKLFGFKLMKRVVWSVNKKKYGIRPLIGFILGFLAFITWTFFISFDTKIEWGEKLIKLGASLGVSIGMIWGAIKFYRRYLPKALDLFRKYSKIKSFKDYLGLQSEIQEELICVLEAYESEFKNKRILLFVDDIDRCSEDRIISIIDSLKVMLDDPYISRRVVVLTAVDERVLKRAIHHKYFNSINNKFLEDRKEKRDIIDTLIREYLDKLFISGIKLSELNIIEREEIFDAFSKGKVRFDDQNTLGKEDVVREEDESPNSDTNDPIDTSLQTLELEKEQHEIEEIQVEENRLEGLMELKIGDDQFEIVESEYITLKSTLKDISSATPRAIKIFYYRYLLAKRLFTHQIPLDSPISLAWHTSGYKEILPRLIALYGSEKTPEELTELRMSLESSSEETFQLQIHSEEYTVNKVVLIELLKIIETVVTY